MATELAKAYVQIIPSAQGISGALTNELNGAAGPAGTSTGKTIGSFLKKALITAGIGKAVKKIFSDAFTNGSELQQNLGGTEAVFGQYASNIQNTATKAYKNMGLSASDYMATANKMASLFQGSGITQKRSLDLTTQAMQRAADVASVMGIDTEWAMESIAGAAKGNFEMMDNLGVAMNATTLQAYALEKGVNFNWNTASNAEKAELAMKMFMERTTQYAGNFARESESTLSGSIGAMKAAYQDLMGNIALGNDIGPSLNALTETVSTFLIGNFAPTMVNIISALPQAFVTLISQLAPAIATGAMNMVMQLGTGMITALPQLLVSANTMMSQLITWIQTKMPLILQRGVEIVTNIANGILQNLPKLILMAGTLITKFWIALQSMQGQILRAGADLLVNIVNGIVNNLPQIVSAAAKVIARFVASMASNLPKILQTGIEMIGKLAAGLIRAIPTLVGKIPQIVSSIQKAFSSIDWGAVGKNIIRGIANGLKNAGGMIIDAAKEAANSALKAAKKALGIESPSTVFRDEVGKMIPAGMAKGVMVNLNPIVEAVERAKKAMINPFEAYEPARIGTYQGTGTAETGLLERLDRLIMLLEYLLENPPEIKTYANDREVIRYLRELGVAFN